MTVPVNSEGNLIVATEVNCMNASCRRVCGLFNFVFFEGDGRMVQMLVLSMVGHLGSSAWDMVVVSNRKLIKGYG